MLRGFVVEAFYTIVVARVGSLTEYISQQISCDVDCVPGLCVCVCVCVCNVSINNGGSL